MRNVVVDVRGKIIMQSKENKQAEIKCEKYKLHCHREAHHKTEN
jgi:hypothetical protein